VAPFLNSFSGSVDYSTVGATLQVSTKNSITSTWHIDVIWRSLLVSHPKQKLKRQEPELDYFKFEVPKLSLFLSQGYLLLTSMLLDHS
jgi:hypothetical protein